MLGDTLPVFEFLENLLRDMDIPESLRALISLEFGQGRGENEVAPLSPARLPLLVHAAVTGDDRPAVPLAGACALVYLGADLFDNLGDDELPGCWDGHDTAQVTLAAAVLLGPMPYLALEQLEADDAARWRTGRELTHALAVISGGQHQDLANAGRVDVTLEGARLVAERKGGEEFRGFARAAAVFAGADARGVDAYGDFAAAIGTAAVIASDVADIWDPTRGNDLRNATRSLPIVHALQRRNGTGGADLEGLLESARHSSDVHPEVRRWLLATGSVQYSALIAETYRHRGLAALDRALPREPAATALRQWSASLSLLPSVRSA